MVEEMEVKEYRMISPGISAPISPHYDPVNSPGTVELTRGWRKKGLCT